VPGGGRAILDEDARVELRCDDGARCRQLTETLERAGLRVATREDLASDDQLIRAA
jgi:hypothetical protein